MDRTTTSSWSSRAMLAFAVAKCGPCSPARSPWEPSRSGISVGAAPPHLAHSWQALGASAPSASVSLTSIRFGLCPMHVYFVAISSLPLPAMATRVSGASLSLRATLPEPAKVGRCSAAGWVWGSCPLIPGLSVLFLPLRCSCSPGAGRRFPPGWAIWKQRGLTPW